MNGISKAINQKMFRSEYHKSIISLVYVFNIIKNNQYSIFKKHNITEQQFNILRILRGSNPNTCSVGLLQERMIDKMSDASRLVERLVKAGLASSCKNKVDGRALDVLITEKGLEVLAEIDKHEAEFNSVINCLSEEETIKLNSYLDKIIDNYVAKQI